MTKYESPLRAEQAEATRARILDGVRAMLARDPDGDFSFDALAVECGVNRRTIFRHFASKEALLAAFWASTNAGLGVRFWPESQDDLTRLPPGLFAALDRVEGVVRAAHASGAGRDMRLAANPERQAAFRASLGPLQARLPPARARALEATVQLMFSATAWLTMRDYWGLPGREAGEAAAWAIDALLRAAEAEANDGTARDPDREKDQRE